MRLLYLIQVQVQQLQQTEVTTSPAATRDKVIAKQTMLDQGITIISVITIGLLI